VSVELDVQKMTAGNRRLIADVLDRLQENQWDAATLCQGWTVKHTAAHLLQPMLVGFGQFFLTSLRYRGDTDRTVDHLTRRLARRHPVEITALLRAHADDQVSPRRVGPWGPFAETCIHLRDIARPLRLDIDLPHQQWVTLLDYLTSAQVAAALVLQNRLQGLRLTATDVDWSHGGGALVSGHVEALALAAAGRKVALEDLQGPGVDTCSSAGSTAPPAREGTEPTRLEVPHR
jgi:uncharacterized protein (TIGR03083 family)